MIIFHQIGKAMIWCTRQEISGRAKIKMGPYSAFHLKNGLFGGYRKTNTLKAEFSWKRKSLPISSSKVPLLISIFQSGKITLGKTTFWDREDSAQESSPREIHPGEEMTGPSVMNRHRGCERSKGTHLDLGSQKSRTCHVGSLVITGGRKAGRYTSRRSDTVTANLGTFLNWLPSQTWVTQSHGTTLEAW